MGSTKGFAVLAVTLACLGAGDPPAMVPDLYYKAGQGDEVFILPQRPVVWNSTSCPEFGKFVRARDVDGLRQLTDDGTVIWTTRLTKVRVLEHYRDGEPEIYEVRILDGPYNGRQAYCPKGSVFALTTRLRRPRIAGDDAVANWRRTQQDIDFQFNKRDYETLQFLGSRLAPPQETERIPSGPSAAMLMKAALDSESKGEKALALSHYRLVVRDFPGSPEAQQAREKIRSLDAANSPQKAATMLQVAHNLEHAGKTGTAREWYRRVVTEYPKTPQATEAQARLQAMGTADPK